MTHHPLAAVLACLIAAGPASAENLLTAAGCLDVTKGGTKVRLGGTLSEAVFPGLPNYESVADGDEAEPTLILRLAEPICIDDGGDFADPAEKFDTVHVSSTDEAVFARLEKAVGKSVTVSGDGFPAHTGHHHAPLVILADSAEVD